MGGTPSFRVSPSTFMVSLELTSSIFQDSSRERIFLYGLVQSLKITFRRKRANWKVNIILREKVSNFIIIYLRIEKFLDRRSTYVREGREGEGRNSRWGKVQRHEAIGLSPLVGSREAATCCISWKAQPDSISFRTLASPGCIDFSIDLTRCYYLQRVLLRGLRHFRPVYY